MLSCCFYSRPSYTLTCFLIISYNSTSAVYKFTNILTILILHRCNVSEPGKRILSTVLPLRFERIHIPGSQFHVWDKQKLLKLSGAVMVVRCNSSCAWNQRHGALFDSFWDIPANQHPLFYPTKITEKNMLHKRIYISIYLNQYIFKSK